eukprot:1137557-Pelagomonas_calceolata.AAC.3
MELSKRSRALVVDPLLEHVAQHLAQHFIYSKAAFLNLIHSLPDISYSSNLIAQQDSVRALFSVI